MEQEASSRKLSRQVEHAETWASVTVLCVACTLYKLLFGHRFMGEGGRTRVHGKDTYAKDPCTKSVHSLLQ
jgi:hypothetical protein